MFALVLVSSLFAKLLYAISSEHTNQRREISLAGMRDFSLDKGVVNPLTKSEKTFEVNKQRNHDASELILIDESCCYSTPQ